jgi:hypothetical protein
MNFFKDALLVIQIALGLLPQILRLVKDLEAEFALPGYGPEKLGLITATVKEAFALLPDDIEKKIGIDKIEKFVTNVVGFIVALLNKAGVFKKGA